MGGWNITEVGRILQARPHTYVLYIKCVPTQYYTVMHSTTQYSTVLYIQYYVSW